MGTRFQLRLPDAAAEQVASSLLDGSTLPDLSHELALAVTETALEDALDAVQLLGRGRPRLLDMRQGMAQAASAGHHLSVLMQASTSAGSYDDEQKLKAPNTITATLQTDSLGLLLLSGLVGKRSPSPARLDDQLVLKLPAEIGYTQISSDLLGTLAIADVVLFDACHVGPQRTVWLTADGVAGLQVQLPEPSAAQAKSHERRDEEQLYDEINKGRPSNEDSFLTVAHAWSPIMTNDTYPATVIETLGDIPIRMSFDLGEVSLTLAEVRALQPGQPIALSRPLQGPVYIRANGALVGEGDLIEIDGRLGVSIRALFAEASQPQQESDEKDTRDTLQIDQAAWTNDEYDEGDDDDAYGSPESLLEREPGKQDAT